MTANASLTDRGPFPQSVHQQQQRQHQLEEKIQLLQQQKLPLRAASDAPAEAELLDTSYGRTESSATSTPNMSPRASNHSAYSSISTSDIGSCLSTEQEEGGKVDPWSFIVSLGISPVCMMLSIECVRLWMLIIWSPGIICLLSASTRMELFGVNLCCSFKKWAKRLLTLAWEDVRGSSTHPNPVLVSWFFFRRRGKQSDGWQDFV